MIASPGKRSVFDRMLSAALLEQETYEEAVLLPEVKGQALLIVLISSFLAGLGNLTGGFPGVVLGFLVALFGWGAFVYASYWAATKHYHAPRTNAAWGATWRTLALASTPRLFLLLAFLPAVGFLLGLALHTWVLIAGVFALRAALDLETKPALIASAAGAFPMFLLWMIVFFLFRL